MSMFARLMRIPLRRCLHTAPPHPTRSYTYFAAGATASLAATYLTWHLTSEKRRIALDSDPKSHDSPSEQASHSSSSSAGEEDAPSGEDAASGGAFNPVTGEINWDCPCLGGMAHGPCGEQFREAFSCFVFSEEEPKGINCVDKFKAMQNCFREHPEVYGDEIMDDDDEEETAPAPAPAPAGVAASTSDVDSAPNPDTLSKGTTPQPSQKTAAASVTP